MIYKKLAIIIVCVVHFCKGMEKETVLRLQPEYTKLKFTPSSTSLNPREITFKIFDSGDDTKLKQTDTFTVDWNIVQLSRTLSLMLDDCPSDTNSNRIPLHLYGYYNGLSALETFVELGSIITDTNSSYLNPPKIYKPLIPLLSKVLRDQSKCNLIDLIALTDYLGVDSIRNLAVKKLLNRFHYKNHPEKILGLSNTISAAGIVDAKLHHNILFGLFLSRKSQTTDIGSIGFSKLDGLTWNSKNTQLAIDIKTPTRSGTYISETIIWDKATKQKIPWSNTKNRLNKIEYSPDGSKFVFSRYINNIYEIVICDSSKQEVFTTIETSSFPLLFSWNKDNKTLASSSYLPIRDNETWQLTSPRITIWDTEQKILLTESEEPFRFRTTPIALYWQPDNIHFSVITRNQKIYTWDTSTGKLIKKQRLRKKTKNGAFTSSAYFGFPSPNKKRSVVITNNILSKTSKEKLVLYDLERGRALKKYPLNSRATNQKDTTPFLCSWSQDSAYYAARITPKGSIIGIFDGETGNLICTTRDMGKKLPLLHGIRIIAQLPLGS